MYEITRTSNERHKRVIHYNENSQSVDENATRNVLLEHVFDHMFQLHARVGGLCRRK